MPTPQPYANSAALQSLFGAGTVPGLGDALTIQAEDQNNELRKRAAAQASAKKAGGPLNGGSTSAALASLFGGQSA